MYNYLRFMRKEPLCGFHPIFSFGRYFMENDKDIIKETEQPSEIDQQIEELMEEGKPGAPKKKKLRKKKIIIAVIALAVIIFLVKNLFFG